MSKNTKNKLIPKLRFVEFNDKGEWSKPELNTIAEPIDVRAGSNMYTTLSVTSGSGLISQKEKFGREISGSQYKNYYVIRRFDFAYNKSATKLYPEGYIALLKDLDIAAVPNSIFTCFRVDKEQVYPQYLDYLFHDNFHGKWLRKFIEVGARAHGSLSIDNDVLFQMPVLLPSPKEQQKIADCLSSLDDLITAENQKLDALKAHKKGLMQQLFPAEGEKVPKLRFKEFKNRGKWEEKTFSELFEIGSGRDYKHLGNGNIPVYGSGGYMLSVDEYLYEGESACIGRKGTIDKPIFLTGKFWTVDTLFYTHSFKGCSPKFIFLVFQNINWLDYNEAGGIPSLSKTTIGDIETLVPKPDEQRRITECVFSLDEIMAEQSEKIESLKTHKKGLMQQLFPNTSEVS
jgi:type I restriction enzyme, S subunit